MEATRMGGYIPRVGRYPLLAPPCSPRLIQRRSGLVRFASLTPSGTAKIQHSINNCTSNGVPVRPLPDSPALISHFADLGIPASDFSGKTGYMNPCSGWAEAGRATGVVLGRVRAMGAVVRPGCEVVGMIREGGAVRELVLSDGEKVEGDLFVVRAWLLIVEWLIVERWQLELGAFWVSLRESDC
jgi:hypothetical protein